MSKRPTAVMQLGDTLLVSEDGRTWTASRGGVTATAERIGDALAELNQRLRAKKAS